MKYDIVQPLLKDNGKNIISKLIIIVNFSVLIYQIFHEELPYDNLFFIFNVYMYYLLNF
jgi:hypothetical protein